MTEQNKELSVSNLGFEGLIEMIEKGASKFDEIEHNLIIAWIEKLTNENWSDDDLQIRDEYAEALAKSVEESTELESPFSDFPPPGSLVPLKTDKSKGTSGSKTPVKSEKSGGGGTPITRPYPSGKSSKSGDTKAPGFSQEGKLGEPSSKDGFRTPATAEGSEGGSKRPYKMAKILCPDPTESTRIGAKPKKTKSRRPKFYESHTNEFEDPEEMAKVIANSKGQSFAEFVVAISRHTLDYGMSLRSAMKAETSNFKEYVDHVLSQRLKDLTEVLDEEQNTELQKIKKDIDKWQVELTHCKKRIKEIIPDFDMDAYKNDPKYLLKIFSFDAVGKPMDDSFKQWKEESCHRLKWYTEMICKMTRCNEQITQEITNVKSQTLELEAREAIKQQTHVQYINHEVNDYQKLKLERDRLHKENADLLSQLQEFGH